MNVIDFHSHILPGIDDGSRSIGMTARMLDACAEQGIAVQIATPHFYADRMNPEAFLERRRAAFEQTLPLAEERGIELLCGAETAFFRSIGQAEILDRLTIEGTRLLLLEMPFRPWTGRDLDEVDRILRRGIRPVIAHVERFYGFQKDRGIVDELIDMPVYVQVNAEALLTWKTRGRMLKLFANGRADLLGSDCHNVTDRAQNLAAGREALRKKLGPQALEKIDVLGGQILRKN